MKIRMSGSRIGSWSEGDLPSGHIAHVAWPDFGEEAWVGSPGIEEHHVVDDWEDQVRGAMTQVAAAISDRLNLAVKLKELECRVHRLECRNPVTQLTTFAAEPFKVLIPIPVAIEFNGDDYIASFFDANVHASGETQQEAFDGLRELLVSTFKILDEHDPEKLGPGPIQQLSVLRSFISRA